MWRVQPKKRFYNGSIDLDEQPKNGLNDTKILRHMTG